ncbi:hypothetical protein D3C75_1058290 [compost metagenome]
MAEQDQPFTIGKGIRHFLFIFDQHRANLYLLEDFRILLLIAADIPGAAHCAHNFAGHQWVILAEVVDRPFFFKQRI